MALRKQRGKGREIAGERMREKETVLDKNRDGERARERRERERERKRQREKGTKREGDSAGLLD